MDFKNFNDTLKVLNEYGDMCIEAMNMKLAPTQIKVSHTLIYENNTVTLKFIYPDYAIFIDKGRKASNDPKKNPPITPIKEWAKKHNLPTFKTKTGKDISEIGRAIMISKSIGRKGIDARPFMAIPIEKSAELADMLGHSFAIDVAQTLQTTFNDAGIGEV